MNGYGVCVFKKESSEKEMSEEFHGSHGIFKQNKLTKGQKFILTEGAEGCFMDYSEGFWNN
jgi:hypothetical protein